MLGQLYAYTVAGEEYDGEFKNHCRHGQGRLTFADGTVYHGGFDNNLRHGKV